MICMLVYVVQGGQMVFKKNILRKNGFLKRTWFCSFFVVFWGSQKKISRFSTNWLDNHFLHCFCHVFPPCCVIRTVVAPSFYIAWTHATPLLCNLRHWAPLGPSKGCSKKTQTLCILVYNFFIPQPIFTVCTSN